MTGHETLAAAAKRLWLAQEELCRAAEHVDLLALDDELLAATISFEGEIFSSECHQLARKARGIALKIDRCVLDNIAVA